MGSQSNAELNPGRAVDRFRIRRGLGVAGKWVAGLLREDQAIGSSASAT